MLPERRSFRNMRKLIDNVKSGRDAVLLFRIAALITFLPLLLQLSLPRLLGLLTPAGRKQDHQPGQEGKIIRYTNYLLGRNTWMFKATCLKRCLVLYRFLREAGLEVGINFGVVPDLRDLKGHCWLTLDGKTFNETRNPDELYQLTYSYPGVPSR